MKFLYSPIIFNGYEYHHDNFIFKDLKKYVLSFINTKVILHVAKLIFTVKKNYYGNEKNGYFSFKKEIRQIQKIELLNIFK